MASDLTIHEAQKQVSKYLVGKGENWTGLSNHYLRVTHMVEEVGELARAVINMDAKYGDPNRRGNNRTRQQKLEEVQDSIGDIFFQPLGISIAYNIDLQNAFQGSMKSILTRYPPTQPAV